MTISLWRFAQCNVPLLSERQHHRYGTDQQPRRYAESAASHLIAFLIKENTKSYALIAQIYEQFMTTYGDKVKEKKIRAKQFAGFADVIRKTVVFSYFSVAITATFSLI